jgi:hypothetical protein
MRFSSALAAVCAIVPLADAWTIESHTGKWFTGTVARYTIYQCSTTSGQLRHNTLSVRSSSDHLCRGYYDDKCQKLWNYIDGEGWGNIGELQIRSVLCFPTE